MREITKIILAFVIIPLMISIVIFIPTLLDNQTFGDTAFIKTSLHVDKFSNNYPYHYLTSDGYWLYPATDDIKYYTNTMITRNEMPINITVRKGIMKDYIIDIDGYKQPVPKATPVRLP
jgi:hypothetical protein